MPNKIHPSVARDAIRTIANKLSAIRLDWQAGDRRTLDLLASGFGGQTSGFASIMREEVRGGVRDHLAAIRHDPDLLAACEGHFDPMLKSELLRLLRALDPEGRMSDGVERWRCGWSGLEIDAELDDVVLRLRFAADALVGDDGPDDGSGRDEQAWRRERREVDWFVETTENNTLCTKRIGKRGLQKMLADGRCPNAKKSGNGEWASIPVGEVADLYGWAERALRAEVQRELKQDGGS